jgi:hypothetical protein
MCVTKDFWFRCWHDEPMTKLYQPCDKKAPDEEYCVNEETLGEWTLNQLCGSEQCYLDDLVIYHWYCCQCRGQYENMEHTCANVRNDGSGLECGHRVCLQCTYAMNPSELAAWDWGMGRRDLPEFVEWYHWINHPYEDPPQYPM